MTQTRHIPQLSTRAAIAPASYDAERRTVEVTWSTGAPVRRFGLLDGPYIEELSLDPGHVRMDRLRSGAPVLASHDVRDLASVIGVVESADVVDGVGRARVRFSQRADVQPIIDDIEAGILRSVSVGYIVHRYEHSAPQERGDLPIYRAVDWEPMEISVVAVPADPSAQIRSSDALHPVIISETRVMTDIIEPTTADGDIGDVEVTRADRPLEVDAVRDEAIRIERSRIRGIIETVRMARLPDTLADQLISSGQPLDQCRIEIMRQWAARTEAAPTIGRVEMVRDESETRLAGMESYLMHRMHPSSELDENGRQYYGHSMVDIARAIIGNASGMSRETILSRAMSTSDFPLLLANVANKTLRRMYEEAPRTFEPITRRVPVPDFKTVSRVALSGTPALSEVPEMAEYTYGALSEAREQYVVKTYGKIIRFSRQAMINDDLGGFMRSLAAFGASAAALESDLVWDQIVTNPTLADGVALFHSTHGNLASTAAAISVTSLADGRKLMRLQKGLEGRYLNLSPSYLLVPAAIEAVAQQYVTATNVVAGKAADVNPFAGTLQVIAEPRLDASSATAWYLAASTSMVDIVELAYLDGQEGIYTEQDREFGTDAFAVKARIDRGAKVIDYRGLVKNAGA